MCGYVIIGKFPNIPRPLRVHAASPPLLPVFARASLSSTSHLKPVVTLPVLRYLTPTSHMISFFTDADHVTFQECKVFCLLDFREYGGPVSDLRDPPARAASLYFVILSTVALTDSSNGALRVVFPQNSVSRSFDCPVIPSPSLLFFDSYFLFLDLFR